MDCNLIQSKKGKITQIFESRALQHQGIPLLPLENRTWVLQFVASTSRNTARTVVYKRWFNKSASVKTGRGTDLYSNLKKKKKKS